MVAATAVVLLSALQLVYGQTLSTLANTNLFSTANPNDPTPAPCIGDPDSCVCVVGGERFSAGERYRQIKDPRSNILQNVFTTNAVDLLFVVDESSSMTDEHYWIRTMIGQLEDALRNIGIGNHTSTPNRYGLVGFGSWKGRGNFEPTPYPMPTGRLMGRAEEFVQVAPDLRTNGLTEDGYRALQFALANYSREIRSRQAARLVVLVTDEDLDNRTGIGFDALLRQLTQAPPHSPQLGFKLNVLINHRFRSGDVEALGVTSRGLAYIDNPRSTNSYVIAFNGEPVPSSGFGNTLESYVRLAWATGGGAWNLKKLFNGGFPVTSFTRSFVDAKVQEALTQLLQCVECVCSAEVHAVGFNAVCNVSHVERRHHCLNDTGEVFCQYKGQVYSVGEEFRDFDILREGLAEPELCVDVIFVVDESGSMVTEHKWLEKLTTMIDNAFQRRDIGNSTQFPNRFGLVGFGSNIEGAGKGRVYSFHDNRWDKVAVAVPDNTDPFYDLVPNGNSKNDTSYWGSAAQFSAVVSEGLFVDGQFEDGYSGIATALKYYHARDTCAHHIVMVTDEDRDHLVELDQDDLKSVLIGRKFILTVAIDLSFLSGGGKEEEGQREAVLGCDRLGQGYAEVRGGPFPYRVRQNCGVKAGSGGRTTEAEYYRLAVSTGGAAWDLKRLRQGGSAAEAFTAAFIEVGIQETVRAFKVCKLCVCNQDGSVTCQNRRKGGLEIDCLIPPEELVTDAPPTNGTAPTAATPSLFASCSSPYNTSVLFPHGSSLAPPPELAACVERLTCHDGRVGVEIQGACPSVNCSNYLIPAPPDCCPVCPTPPPPTPPPDKDAIDFDNLQSSGPRGRSVTLLPADITMATGKTLVLSCQQKNILNSRTQLQWFREAEPLNSSSLPGLRVEGAELTVGAFDPREHAGVYACVLRSSRTVYGSKAVVRSEDGLALSQQCLLFDGRSSSVALDKGAFAVAGNAYEELRLSFTALKRSGVIYAALDNRCKEHLLIFMCKGILKLVWNLGGTSGQINSKNVALNMSHHLQVTRFGSSLTFSLDGVTTDRMTSSAHNTLETTQHLLGSPASSCSKIFQCRIRDMYFKGRIGDVKSVFNSDFDINAYPSTNTAHCSLLP